MDNPETATAEDAKVDAYAEAEAEAVVATDNTDNKGHTAIMKDMEDLEEEHAFWSDMLSVTPEEQIEFETETESETDIAPETETKTDNTGNENTEIEIESKSERKSKRNSKSNNSNLTGNKDMDNSETATEEDADTDAYADTDADADADAEAKAVIATDKTDNKGHTAIMKDMEDLEVEHAFWSDMLSVTPEEQIEFETETESKSETDIATENDTKSDSEIKNTGNTNENREYYDLMDEFDSDNENTSLDDNGNGKSIIDKPTTTGKIKNYKAIEIEHIEYELMDEFDNNYGPITEYGDYNEEALMLEFDDMKVTDNKVVEIGDTTQQLNIAKERKKKKKKKRSNNIAHKKLKTFKQLESPQTFWYRDKLVYDAYSKKKRNKKYDDCHSELPQ